MDSNIVLTATISTLSNARSCFFFIRAAILCSNSDWVLLRISKMVESAIKSEQGLFLKPNRSSSCTVDPNRGSHHSGVKMA